MRAVIQRVSEARVIADNQCVGEIHSGFLIYLGVSDSDTEDDLHWLVKKACQLRIFDDSQGHMNLSLSDVNANVLVISQFTLLAKTKKGNRPSFVHAANPQLAESLYLMFISALKARINMPVQSGKFGAKMSVHSINDGPVTILIDTKNKE